MGDVIAVCGLNREAALLRGAGVRVIAGGGDPARLAAALKDAAASADGIISIGLAGGLDARLGIGDWLIGEGVTGAYAAQCDTAWADALAARMPAARRGLAYADGRLIEDPADKRALRTTGALAADMESHIAAQAASEAGLPFAILRCVSDTVDQAVPPAIAVAMRPDGGLALGAILSSVIRNPKQIPDLMESSRLFQSALAALEQGAGQAGPRFAFDSR